MVVWDSGPGGPVISLTPLGPSVSLIVPCLLCLTLLALSLISSPVVLSLVALTAALHSEGELRLHACPAGTWRPAQAESSELSVSSSVKWKGSF